MKAKTDKYWDRAWSLVEGCSPVSEGCLNCWSASQSYIRSHQKNPKIRARYQGLTEIRNGHPAFNGRIRLMWDDLEKPLRVTKPTVWAIWNDFLNAPPKFIDAAFEVIGACPEHTFLILTKRPEQLVTKIYSLDPDVPIRHLGGGDYFPNLYWGVTVELPKYEHRIDELVKIPGHHFISIEPCLGLIDIRQYLGPQRFYSMAGVVEYDIDGVILGGETGPGARPMHPDWVRSIRDQCVEADIPYFFKQWGEWIPRLFLKPQDKQFKGEWGTLDIDGNFFLETTPWNGNQGEDSQTKEYVVYKVGKKKAGRLLDGREWNGLPWI